MPTKKELIAENDALKAEIAEMQERLIGWQNGHAELSGRLKELEAEAPAKEEPPSEVAPFSETPPADGPSTVEEVKPEPPAGSEEPHA